MKSFKLITITILCTSLFFTGCSQTPQQEFKTQEDILSAENSLIYTDETSAESIEISNELYEVSGNGLIDNTKDLTTTNKPEETTQTILNDKIPQTEKENLENSTTHVSSSTPKPTATPVMSQTEKPINNTSTIKPEHNHSWKNATCTTPKTCATCGATEGSTLEHSYREATCTNPKQCSTCGYLSGNALGHASSKQSCTTDSNCTRCGVLLSTAKGHTWTEATCDSPKNCTTCGVTEGEKLEHRWQCRGSTGEGMEPGLMVMNWKCVNCGLVVYQNPSKEPEDLMEKPKNPNEILPDFPITSPVEPSYGDEKDLSEKPLYNKPTDSSTFKEPEMEFYS